ncbi:hypothetical protein J2T12_000357 [Paenibacillus anaericanus]|uniref:transcriptional regulator n=1 Tax=Paenibacillus anaericanus TaxID=170367 RepID=UPI00277FFD0A|nr:transcriptional regulator [Paenibacillus anaericanus]MDQ0086963.1 hypothetical protein [Paenibacillus anaericanus]
MSNFEQKYEEWMQTNITTANFRRRELLEKGLGHGSVEFLRTIWFPTVKNFDNLYPEWEVRDYHNGFRYVDLAYMPGGMKGGIEIQGFGPHARDLDVKRFKDLCWRQCLLALDDWLLLPIAYLSIKDEPQQCQQLILSFIGRFISSDLPCQMTALEAETLRFSRRLLHPFTPLELAEHLRITERYARQLLHKLVDLELIDVTNGKIRYRVYRLRN